MIKRIDDFSFLKLFKHFVTNIQSGKYKMHNDVTEVKENLIPKLAADFEKHFPIGTKDENPLENFKYLTARKTIEHFID